MASGRECPALSGSDTEISYFSSWTAATSNVNMSEISTVFHVGAFSIFLLWSWVASRINHIDDTDETYGYWEPLHYLLFGEGLQTWEYAPEFSIRTYSFIYPIYLFAQALVSMGLSKVTIFYAIRCFFWVFDGV